MQCLYLPVELYERLELDYTEQGEGTEYLEELYYIHMFKEFCKRIL